MATASLTDDALRETLELFEAHGRNQQHAANAAGMSRSTFQSRLRAAELRGIVVQQPMLETGDLRIPNYEGVLLSGPAITHLSKRFDFGLRPIRLRIGLPASSEHFPLSQRIEIH